MMTYLWQDCTLIFRFHYVFTYKHVLFVLRISLNYDCNGSILTNRSRECLMFSKRCWLGDRKEHGLPKIPKLYWNSIWNNFGIFESSSNRFPCPYFLCTQNKWSLFNFGLVARRFSSSQCTISVLAQDIDGNIVFMVVQWHWTVRVCGWLFSTTSLVSILKWAK